MPGFYIVLFQVFQHAQTNLQSLLLRQTNICNQRTFSTSLEAYKQGSQEGAQSLAF